MDHYVNIELLPCQEASQSHLMNVLYSRLHKALVTVGQGEIGISFPYVGRTLGSILRLHGPQSALKRLMEQSWSEGIIDYVSLSQISKIPESVTYRTVRRVQVKSNTERLMRRSLRKGWLKEEEAVERLSAANDKTLSLPYIHLQSQSTKQAFRLFIEHGPFVLQPAIGAFSSYGLSSTATIPWF